jgi:hypothetical protein
MTAIKKLTSFSVRLQCAFACTIGPGILLKWNWPFAALGLVSLGLNVNPEQPGRGVSGKGRCSKWHPHESKLLNCIFGMSKL